MRRGIVYRVSVCVAVYAVFSVRYGMDHVLKTMLAETACQSVTQSYHVFGAFSWKTWVREIHQLTAQVVHAKCRMFLAYFISVYVPLVQDGQVLNFVSMASTIVQSDIMSYLSCLIVLTVIRSHTTNGTKYFVDIHFPTTVTFDIILVEKRCTIFLCLNIATPGTRVIA